jgi:hypothetical protein
MKREAAGRDSSTRARNTSRKIPLATRAATYANNTEVLFPRKGNIPGASISLIRIPAIEHHRYAYLSSRLIFFHSRFLARVRAYAITARSPILHCPLPAPAVQRQDGSPDPPTPLPSARPSRRASTPGDSYYFSIAPPTFSCTQGLFNLAPSPACACVCVR